MPRINSTAWSVWNPVTSSRLNAINTDIDDIYAKGDDRMKIYHLAADAALLVRIGAGVFRVWDQEWQYAGWSLTVWATATTYIMVDNAGVIQTSITAWNANYARLGVVVSSAWVITSITIHKVDAVGGLLAWKGIPDMSASAVWTPLSYATQSVTGPEFRPQLAADWAGYLWIPGMDWVVSKWTLVTYGSWTDGVNTTQIAYSNLAPDGRNYIFQRRWTSSTVWGSWLKISWSEQLKTAWEAITVSSAPIAVSKDTTGNIIYSNTSAYNRSNFYWFIRSTVANTAQAFVACNNWDIVWWFSWLTAWISYYLSSTNWVISSTVGALYTRVWYAISTTEIIIDKEIEVARVTAGTWWAYPGTPTVYSSTYTPTHDFTAIFVSKTWETAATFWIQVNSVDVLSETVLSNGTSTTPWARISGRANGVVRARLTEPNNWTPSAIVAICKTFS